MLLQREMDLKSLKDCGASFLGIRAIKVAFSGGCITPLI
jgi:hypothetical protein